MSPRRTDRASGARDGHSMKVAERSRVDLPAHVPDEFEVFVAGVRQARGVDYEVVGRSLVFPRAIEQEGRLGFWRWTGMWLGVVGSYRKHETVDVVYQMAGRKRGETGPVPRAHGDQGADPPSAGADPPDYAPTPRAG